MVVRSLSVKSMASCGPATPRFSMVGILWPVEIQKEKGLWSTMYCHCQKSSVASALFRHTSKVKFALLQRVQIGQGIVDEVGGEPHPCGEGNVVVVLVAVSTLRTG